MIKKLYDSCIELARHKFSKPMLGFISFIESSFFPIPPDVMIVPMVIAKKEDYFKIFLISTIFSVLGGLLGYFIGSYLIEYSMFIIEIYGYENKVIEIQNKLSSDTGVLMWLGVLFVAGFTPLPYKVFTISSGIVNFNIYLFILTSLFARGLRFFLVSYFSMKFGEKFGGSLQRDTEKWFLIIGIFIILILVMIFFLNTK